MNPSSLSGSKPLFESLNTIGVTYSYDHYRKLRTQLINQEIDVEGSTFPFPKFDPSNFHVITIDNYDANKPSSENPGNTEQYYNLCIFYHLK